MDCLETLAKLQAFGDKLRVSFGAHMTQIGVPSELALWRYAGEVIPGAERATACAVCSCTLYVNSTLELEECVIVQINHCVNNTSLYKL